MSPPPTSSLPLLRALALAQGIAIAGLGVLVLQRSGEIAPAVAPSAADADTARAPTAATATTTAAGRPAVADAATRAPGDEPAKAAASTGTVIYGRVTNGAGALVPAYVWFTRAGEAKAAANVHVDERSPCFAIAGLEPGELTFQSRATGYKEARGTIVIPPATPRLRHDIVLQEAWELSVKIVTPDGTPLSTALAAAAKDRPGLFQVEVAAIATATKPAGDFPLSGLREMAFGLGRWQSARYGSMRGEKQKPKDVAGVIELDAKQPIWVSAVMRHRVLTSIAVEAGQPEAVLTVALEQILKDLGTIRGRVVDATGKPLAKVRVGFGDQQSGGGGKPVGDDGRFEGTNLRPGLLTLEVYGEQVSMRPLVLLQPGQTLDLGDVPVPALRTIKGRCEGLTSKPESFSITTMPLDPPVHPALRHDSAYAQVAADGSFTLYLTEGRHRVRASGAGGAVVEIDTRALGDETLVLRLAKEVPLRLEVHGDDEPPELALFDASNREVWRRALGHGWKFPLLLLPGDYRIELTDARGKVETRRITLGEAGADLRVP